MPLLQIKDYYRLLIFCSKLMCMNSFKCIKDDILEIDWKLTNNITYLSLTLEGEVKDCSNFGVINGRTEFIEKHKYYLKFDFDLNKLEEIRNKFFLLDTIEKFNL